MVARVLFPGSNVTGNAITQPLACIRPSQLYRCTQLQQKAQRILATPQFDHLAISNPHEVHPRHDHLFPRWRKTREASCMSSAQYKTESDRIPLADHLLNRYIRVREGRAKDRNSSASARLPVSHSSMYFLTSALFASTSILCSLCDSA